MDYSAFYDKLQDTVLSGWMDPLKSKIDTAMDPARHGDLLKWQQLYNQLPIIHPSVINLNSSAVQAGCSQDCDQNTRQNLETLLRAFHPWRKGPWSLFDIYIDTEWRSDWKWERIKNSLQPLTHRLVLDVGCGNGYHCWRMLGDGAGFVVGIDPYLLSVMQFHILKRYLQNNNAWVLPLGIEDMPSGLTGFDTVFSMGVFYHRKSPFEHLAELKSYVRDNGQVILETLVIDGPDGHVLVPTDRYARMRNVWFIPSCLTLESWLKRAGFKNIQCINTTRTTTKEQRATPWMTWDSLRECLNPDNPAHTIEGYPAPVRAVYAMEK